MSSWYSDHPVVSTVLWLMGGTNNNDIEEDEEKKPTRCLSWRDEHDGSPIAEYMTSPKIPRTEVKFNNAEEANKSISKKKSLPVLPRSDSDVGFYFSLMPNSLIRLISMLMVEMIMKI